MKIKIIVIIGFVLLSFLASSNVWAVSAYPHQILVKTQNDKNVTIFLRGDENLKYAITNDGYTLLNDNDGWWYATTENGRTVKSDFRLMAIEDETQDLKQFKMNCPKGIVPKQEMGNQIDIDKISKSQITPKTPIIGERRALVIMMQFKDLTFKHTHDDFHTLFNAIGYHDDSATGSVRDFYQFASQGQLDYVSDVYGPYTAVNKMDYYGGNATIGGYDAHAVELCVEAMMNLPDTIDFSIYDNDNDGLIDNVHIIFAGYGEEAGGPANAIWSHEYPHRLILANGIGLAGYSCSPELRGNNGSNISHIGVICHELGHALGAMDYYDTNYGTDGEYEGTGQWDIMASGSWNDNGRTPPNFNPYVRSVIFGWNMQETLVPNQQIMMPRMEIGNEERTKVYRLETGSIDDYFLLENRQQYGFDAALPGKGLMIYHVHPYIDRYQLTNTINATHPQGLYPVCASFSEPDKKKYGNINSTECPFPGSSNTKNFTASSSPAAVAWDGNTAKIALLNITDNQNGIVTFTTGEGCIIDPEQPDALPESEIVYKESFETTLTDVITINTIRGNEKWKSYSKGDPVIGLDNIPEPTDGEKLLMLFSGKSNVINEAEAVGPYITIEIGKSYIFTFDINLVAESNQPTPQFCLYIENEYGERNVYSLNEKTENWKQIELPLVFNTDKFRYKLYGNIISGGIFIDNIRLLMSEATTSDKSIHKSICSDSAAVYSLNGVYIGNYHSIRPFMKKGLYIIRDRNNARKLLISN